MKTLIIRLLMEAIYQINELNATHTMFAYPHMINESKVLSQWNGILLL